MEKGSFEMPSLEATKRPRSRAWIVLCGLIGLIVIAAVIAMVSMDRATDVQSRQETTSAPCVPPPSHPETVIPDSDRPLESKSTNPADYPRISEAPLAVVCGPASVFPPDSPRGIILEDAVYGHCALEITGPDALCRLEYASGPRFLTDQDKYMVVNVEGRHYGNCRFEGPADKERMPSAGRDDRVAERIRCFLLPVR